MSNKPGAMVQIVGVAVGTVVAVIAGAMVTGSDPSPLKGAVFAAVASTVAGIIFRKLLLVVVVLAVAFGLYMFIAPHVGDLLPHLPNVLNR